MFYFQAKKKKKKKNFDLKSEKKKKKNCNRAKPNRLQRQQTLYMDSKKKKEKIKKIQTPIQVTEQITSKSEIMKGFIKEKEITKLLKA